MKLLTLTLLLANTKAKVLTAPAFCGTAETYKLYNLGTTLTARQFFKTAAIECKKDEPTAVPADKKLLYSQMIE